MIQEIFNKYNTNKLSGHIVVEELIPTIGSPTFAEKEIKSAIDDGLLEQKGSSLVLITPETNDPNDAIKKAWFYLRQMEKRNVAPAQMKKYAEAFVKNFGWNYYIFNKDLRQACEALGYHSEPSERSLFNKMVLQA